jgi:GNAT superfamily N-acetyltransferase
VNIVVKRLDADRLRGTPWEGELQGAMAEIDARYSPPGGCFLVAADWGAAPGDPIVVAGTAGFRRVTPEVCEVGRLVVKKAFQGQGVGRLLLRALSDQARAAGYSRMRAEAPADITSLVAFYKREGFNEVSAFRIATLEELEGRVFLERSL